MPSDSQPVTEEMVEAAAHAFGPAGPVFTSVGVRVFARRMLEAAQAVAPPKDSGYEAAAKICDAIAGDTRSWPDKHTRRIAGECAARIRLAGKASSPAAPATPSTPSNTQEN